MHTLLVDTASKLGHCPERVVRDAYDYAEKPKTLNAVVHAFKWFYLNDKITPEVEDYCIDVLAGRAEPLR